MKRFLVVGVLAAILLGSRVDASLFTYFQEQGLTLPSVAERRQEAEKCGVDGYRGTRDQNLRLENCLKSYYVEELPAGTARLLKEPILGGTTPRRPTEFKTYLNEQKTEGHSDTTVKVTSVQTKDGNYIDGSLLGDIIVLTINSGASNSENVRCTGVTTSTQTFTGCQFGFRFDDPLATQAGNIKPHSPGESVIISNTDTFLAAQYFTLDGNHIVTGSSSWNGIQTFTVFPEVSGAQIPTTSDQFATKRYADNLANVGSATSTQGAVGLILIGNPTQMASSTDLGANYPYALTTKFSTSSCEFATSSAVVTNHLGRINVGCIDRTSYYSFSSDFTLTGNVSSTGNVTSTGSVTTTGQWNMATTTISSSTIRQVNAKYVSSSAITINGLDGNVLATGSTTDAVNYHMHSAQCAIFQGTQAINATGNFVNSHGLGVAPSYAEFWATSVTDDGGTSDIANSHCFYEATSARTSTAQFCTISVARAAATIAYVSGNRTNAIISLLDASGNVDAEATFSATASNFTLNFGTNVNAGGGRNWTGKICK